MWWGRRRRLGPKSTAKEVSMGWVGGVFVDDDDDEGWI